MSLPAKSTSLQAYNMRLYRGVLHPEFFGIEGRYQIKYGEYDFEAWIFRGGHALRFQHEDISLSEIIYDDVESLPERGLVSTLPCAGEKDHEAKFGERMVYMTSMQTEVLSDHLYLGTYQEMIEHARNAQTLLSVWNDHIGKPNMSLLDMQRHRDQMHVQSYHLRSDCGLVLRTQSIFQLKDEDDVDEPTDDDTDPEKAPQ